MSSHTTPVMSVDAQNKLVAGNCAICHDNDAKTGGLSLEDFDAAQVDQHAETARR